MRVCVCMNACVYVMCVGVHFRFQRMRTKERMFKSLVRTMAAIFQYSPLIASFKRYLSELF
jgi:hypothetical protein